ncbi:conserved hypothetical protein [Deferribacter desulfuricans SSM1]|uniref:Nucleoid-associated protein DEFDS_0142 n=1 Tax=Deferribacter desulfuricans (strain DSM 14783 / JCM 11476 / NBRC 101012 / SSM1) TaxID=639282 RepID=D3PAN1_DEFDS|nr:YbaB/EbfC family nucleoid-associated protein [Deferribacter desulfuricans]BAI79654.1 conserved hypothetical protein [Deferribacter desulfuricans SSM1]
MNIQQLMKQAQKMQKKMLEMQEEAAKEVVEASAGGGMVTVKVNGKQELVEIKIEKDVVDPEDVEMLQDLVLAAVNEGIKKSQELMQEKMSKLTGGMGLNFPGMF